MGQSLADSADNVQKLFADQGASRSSQASRDAVPAEVRRPSGLDGATALWLKRADQFLLGILLIALVILLAAFRWKLSGGGQSEIEIVSQQPREFFYSIDINKASWVEWAQLDGIGEKLGRRIVKDREDNGRFASVADLIRVKGLGPKLIEKIKPFLKCETLDGTAEDRATAVKGLR